MNFFTRLIMLATLLGLTLAGCSSPTPTPTEELATTVAEIPSTPTTMKLTVEPTATFPPIPTFTPSPVFSTETPVSLPTDTLEAPTPENDSEDGSSAQNQPTDLSGHIPTSGYSGTRLYLDPGATYGVFSSVMSPKSTANYLIAAEKDQPLIISLSTGGNITMDIINTIDGTILGHNKDTWQGLLPSSGEYLIQLNNSGGEQFFSLSFNIPARPYFGSENKVSIRGSTPGGYPVSYVVSLAEGQKLNTYLDETNIAYLSIRGFEDGTYYLRTSDKSSKYSGHVNKAQDYIITVVPIGDAVVNYSLSIVIR